MENEGAISHCGVAGSHGYGEKGDGYVEKRGNGENGVQSSV